MRVTGLGKSAFVDYIDSLKTDVPKAFPENILVAGPCATPIGGTTDWLDDLDLDDRLATARGLYEIVEKLELNSAERDSDFWIWCSAYLFDRLCKRSKSKALKPGEMALWIPQPDNWKRYYRHYLASIWRIYLAHKDREKHLAVLLNGPVNTPGELWGQLAANQRHVTNPAMIEVFYHLYWNKENGERKRGAGGISPRRLMLVLKQFGLTWDFVAMTGDQIVSLLPNEFDRFKELSSSG